MSSLIAIAKVVGTPGSLRLLEIATVAGLAWIYVWPKKRRSGWLFLAVLLTSYLVLALPAVAAGLAAKLPVSPTPTRAQIGEIRTLFVFDGDNRWGRLREVERIYQTAEPKRIVLLGRLSVYKDLLLMPIPRERLEHDDSSFNTRSQVQRVRELLGSGASPSEGAAILASRLQAPRVERFVASEGLAIPVVPSELDVDLPSHGWRRWCPTLSALAVTRDAIYELAALRYYE